MWIRRGSFARETPIALSGGGRKDHPSAHSPSSQRACPLGEESWKATTTKTVAIAVGHGLPVVGHGTRAGRAQRLGLVAPSRQIGGARPCICDLLRACTTVRGHREVHSHSQCPVGNAVHAAVPPVPLVLVVMSVQFRCPDGLGTRKISSAQELAGSFLPRPAIAPTSRNGSQAPPAERAESMPNPQHSRLP
jgi:hypothetical protein